MRAKEAKEKYIASVHARKHVDLIRKISSKDSSDLKKTAKKFDSVYFSKGSSESAFLAAGSVIEVISFYFSYIAYVRSLVLYSNSGSADPEC